MARPLIIAHGWPGSVFEQIKLIAQLTDPTRYGGRAEDAFDVVIASLPGFGFSGRPTEAGWGPERIGPAFDVLMTRLGYTRYVAQGGDRGADIVEAMGRQAPAGLRRLDDQPHRALRKPGGARGRPGPRREDRASARDGRAVTVRGSPRDRDPLQRQYRRYHRSLSTRQQLSHLSFPRA